MKRIAVLGSTGSIGVNTLDVISRLKGLFSVAALSADSNMTLLAAQARRFRPAAVCAGNGDRADAVKAALPPRTKILSGVEGLRELAGRSDIDLIVFAISGNACLEPLIEAIRHKKAIALANKESIVSAGALITDLARKNGVKIIPVDSEHSAIFQCIDGAASPIDRIYLTGSGGPLLDIPRSRFDSLSAAYILRHPRWRMGRKISVDSATMMNKGLEIIEAQHLFGVDESDIEVMVHPEAIIHSMVGFSDGAVLAQLAVPDMRLPIEYALTYPRRAKAVVRRVDLAGTGALTFRRPDIKKFPCLGLARAAAAKGGTAPAALCASDEVAVERYLAGAIRFTDIPKIIEKVLARHASRRRSPSLADIREADGWAREEARSLCCR